MGRGKNCQTWGVKPWKLIDPTPYGCTRGSIRSERDEAMSECNIPSDHSHELRTLESTLLLAPTDLNSVIRIHAEFVSFANYLNILLHTIRMGGDLENSYLEKIRDVYFFCRKPFGVQYVLATFLFYSLSLKPYA